MDNKLESFSSCEPPTEDSWVPLVGLWKFPMITIAYNVGLWVFPMMDYKNIQWLQMTPSEPAPFLALFSLGRSRPLNEPTSETPNDKSMKKGWTGHSVANATHCNPISSRDLYQNFLGKRIEVCSVFFAICLFCQRVKEAWKNPEPWEGKSWFYMVSAITLSGPIIARYINYQAPKGHKWP